jgi:hypothetical protein
MRFNIRFAVAMLCLLACACATAQPTTISVATLNTYWFMGEETYRDAETPRSKAEHEFTAAHLIGLLPLEAPLFIGLQEVGNGADIQVLAQTASRRYEQQYQHLFVQGKVTATKQDVGALLDTTRGWGVYCRPARDSGLDNESSKHLVVRITNAVAAMDVCVDIAAAISNNP